MKKTVLMALAASLAAGALAQSTVVYAPVRSISDQGISLKGWGSGTISETDEVAFEGTRSIRVSTRNYFQGGVMTFAKPVELGGAFSDKNNLLRFAIRVADMNLTLGGGTSGGGGKLGGGGAAGPGTGAGAGGGGGDIGVGPGTQGGGRPAGAGGSTLTEADTTLKFIRVIVTTTDGKKSEAYVPLTTGGGGERGWKSVSVPLQSITGLADTNKTIKQIAFSGDAISTFYVGDIRTVNDSTPITGSINATDMNLALGDEVELRAWGNGGSSVLKYTWDFDAKDGIQIDAEGQTVKRKFRKPGKYVITLTIVDANGLKKSFSTTVNATVNP